jgi:hypothetical protein
MATAIQTHILGALECVVGRSGKSADPACEHNGFLGQQFEVRLLELGITFLYGGVFLYWFRWVTTRAPWKAPGLFWSPEARPLSPPRPLFGHIGYILVHLGLVFDHLGPISVHLGHVWRHLGFILASSWPYRGPSWPLKPSKTLMFHNKNPPAFRPRV